MVKLFLTQKAQESFFAFGVFISFWHIPNYQIFIELFLCARHLLHKTFCLAGEIQIKQMITQVSI